MSVEDGAEPMKAGWKADEEGAAFVRTFLQHRDRLENMLTRRVGSRADAADLVQDLFLRLWKRPLERPENTAGYLYRSARNLAIDHHRATNHRDGLDGGRLAVQCRAEPTQPDAAAAANLELTMVGRALRALPDRTRHVFLLNRVHGRSYGDIARALNVSVSTVEKEMIRALAACRAHARPDSTGEGE